MSVKAWIVSMFSVLTVAFLAVFFLTTPPFEYTYDKTVTAEVVTVFKSGEGRYKTGIQKKIKLQIRYDDGTSQIVRILMTRQIIAGEIIDLDVYQADGKKPRYQLAQRPIQP